MDAIYDKNKIKLYLQDAFECLKNIEKKSVDMIFVDPPYFLSNNGITCKSGKMASVNKGKWDKCDDKFAFNREWIRLCFDIMKENATIWTCGTLHNIYSIGYILEEEGFKIINNITWQKTNPPPNLACRCFTHSTETVLWAKKANGKHFFNYDLMKRINNNKQMKDVWTGSLTPPTEKMYGKHPAQKPLYLLDRIVNCSTKMNDLVLDPFCGTGTTGVICKRLKRNFIGIDNNSSYIKIAIKRIENG